jgi:hypothetical protein
MSTRINARRGRRGASLLEVLLATGCTALLLGSIATVAKRGKDASSAGVSASVVSAQAQRLVDRIATELVNVSSSSLPLAPAAQRAASWIEFRQVQGFSNGNVVEGAERKLARVASPEDPDDGQDNDRDGMIDEGDIVLVLDTAASNPRNLVIARGVPEVLEGEIANNNVDDNGNGLIDEPGLALVWASGGNSVTVRATVGQRAPDGSMQLRTVTTTVHLRN